MPFRWFACIELFGAIQFDDIVRRLDGLSSGLSLHTIKVQILKTLKKLIKECYQKTKKYRN